MKIVNQISTLTSKFIFPIWSDKIPTALLFCSSAQKIFLAVPLQNEITLHKNTAVSSNVLKKSKKSCFNVLCIWHSHCTFGPRCSLLACTIKLPHTSKFKYLLHSCLPLGCSIHGIMYSETPVVYKKGCSVFVRTFCILEYGGVQECYTGTHHLRVTRLYPSLELISSFSFFSVLINCAQCDDNNPEHADKTSTEHFILICIDFLCC